MNDNNCTYYEEQASALLDAELDPQSMLELVDHVVHCASCQSFYTGARELGGLVAVVRPPRPAQEVPPQELWARIEQSAPQGSQEARAYYRVPAWALRAAAAVVVAVGLGLISWFGTTPAIQPTEAVVQLGGDAGTMTEDRFVELTKEVLRSEPRYHNAMHRVMQQVLHDTQSQETSAEYDMPLAPGETETTERLDRQPV